MNNIQLNITAGGIFSKYMYAIQNLAKINREFDNTYLNITDSRFIDERSINPFDFVINQNNSINYEIFNAEKVVNYSNHNPIEHSNNLNLYKHIVTKISIHNDILEYTDKLSADLGINNNSIGVHIRLTDMNIIHAKDYGISTYSNYLITMKKFENSDFFIASDNNESISKLINEFGGRIKYIPDLIRATKETEDTTNMHLSELKYERIWREAFIEMLLLAKCGTIICRSSNLANAAILNSKTINNIIRI